LSYEKLILNNFTATKGKKWIDQKLEQL